MTVQPSRRVQSIGGYAFAEVDNLVAELKAKDVDVIDFGVGDPTIPTPALIREACKALKSERLTGLDSYVTLEPCPTCAGAIAAARLGRVYYGAADPKSGGVEQGPRVFSHPQSHHKPEVYAGIAEDEAADLLRNFFKERR